MTEKLRDLMVNLARNPSACNWFQFFANETWDRIGYARTRRGHAIHEPTITQNLIFEFHTSKDLYLRQMRTTWGLDILESVNERANGNDIELFVEVGNTVIFFAVQAKIIDHYGFNRQRLSNGRYTHMNHVVGTNNQIDLLINYANRKHGIPLYLLYNWVNKTLPKKRQCDLDYDIEQFGCSIIDANYIRSNYIINGQWQNVTFSDIHPAPALPWFVIPCCFVGNTIDDVLKLLGETTIKADNVGGYDIRDLQTDKEWKAITPFDENIPSEQEINESSNSEGSPNIEFNPRYRIIVSQPMGLKSK